MEIVVCGSRSIKDYSLVKDVIEKAPFYEIDLIVHGGAKGVDSMADRYAALNGIETKTVEPDYDKYSSKRAPIERNKRMLSAETGIYPSGMIAIREDNSSGTQYMIDRASDLAHLRLNSTDAYDDVTVFYFGRALGTSPTIL